MTQKTLTAWSTTRATSALLLCCALLVGCFGTIVGYEFLPERSYYDMFEDFAEVTPRHVRHVRSSRRAVYFLGSELRSCQLRETIEEALAENPNYYLKDLTINTDTHSSLDLLSVLTLFLPRVTVEFDVVELLPRPASGEPP